MFLKSLEIRGFKSFADKTELVFKEGITAIVGPNGSGKSNILDAVKWALGEQSVKNLRGGKMQDVIFSGTQFRKPVGLAQVTMVLDNSDGELPIEYSNVNITRRLFRSGESEYYINNTKCRLRDIQELFMDTGIGKEGYSIIGQGKIEAVLSGKPEERRGLLEEAAGIVKFKTRKEEAEKRLENTDQNIQRINDIFSTYEERIEPLKQDSQKAKIFIELSEKLKSKEVTLLLNNVEEINIKIQNINSLISEGEGEINNLTDEKHKCKIKIEDLNKKLETIEAKNNEERNRYYNNKTNSQKLSSEIDLLKERISNLTNTEDKSTRDYNNLKEKLHALIGEKAHKESKLKKLIEEQNRIQGKIHNFESLISDKNKKIFNHMEELKRLKAYQIELLSNISQSKNEINILKNNKNVLKSKLEELKGSKEAYLNSININESTKSILKKEIAQTDLKIDECNTKIKEYKKQIFINNKKLNEWENDFKKISISYNKIEANRNALINLEKKHEGYNKAVKVLMQHIDMGKILNVSGKTHILGELLKVNKELETAIEVALGGTISNIVTDDDIIAKKLIQYLKYNNLGRATFLPLSIIKGKKISLNPRIKGIPGYIGVASELISFEDKYIEAINYSLGRTIVAKNMDSALEIARASNFTFKIVTLEGEVINIGGALTGGSVYHKSLNIISRKREIDELGNELKISTEKLSELTISINNIKCSIKKMDDRCLDLKDEIYYANIEKTKINGKISAIDNETQKLRKDLNVASNEIVMVSDNLNNVLDELELKNKKIEEQNKLEKQNTITITKFEEELEREQNEIGSTNSEITSLRIEKAKLDENILNENKEFQRIGNEMEDITSKISMVKSETEHSTKEIGLAKQKIQWNNEEIKKINNIIIAFEEKFKNLEVNIIKIKTELKNTREELEKISMLYEKSEKVKNNLRVNLARCETEKEAMLNKLNEEMNLTYAEALEIRIKNENIEQCKNDIIIYKDKISNLGVVNLGAIEEYKELMEKYNFMSAQKDDLIKAKEELLSVVKEMTNKMKIVFHENFEKLRKNFDETFKELFKGGNADLIIKDGNELTGNIEINVQPPGKKLQNINLMSGGEKGLSAIALLFAILKMKPTPFCILDEIEAALDEVNVYRYSEFLKKFSKNTQFIIITHRKGSMESGDVLYGVTMEERGISKIVSVDLSK